jgi:hypothetical protein
VAGIVTHCFIHKVLEKFNEDIKGIVSRDFEVCFLVPLDSSDIATPSGAGSFFFLKSISCRIFDFSGLGASSFRSARLSAQSTSRAHFVVPDSVQQRIG